MWRTTPSCLCEGKRESRAPFAGVTPPTHAHRQRAPGAAILAGSPRTQQRPPAETEGRRPPCELAETRRRESPRAKMAPGGFRTAAEPVVRSSTPPGSGRRGTSRRPARCGGGPYPRRALPAAPLEPDEHMGAARRARRRPGQIPEPRSTEPAIRAAAAGLCPRIPCGSAYVPAPANTQPK